MNIQVQQCFSKCTSVLKMRMKERSLMIWKQKVGNLVGHADMLEQ